MAAMPISYCADLVRRYDKDRFLCTLFASPAEREALCAAYAFNLEVARIPEQAREPLLRQIRLRWWSDSLDAVFGDGTPSDNGVLKALAAAAERFPLDRAKFDRLLGGRERDLQEAAPANLDELIDYADATSGSLNAIGLDILRIDDAEARSAAREVGIGWALVGLLRAVPFHARARRIYLPADLNLHAGLDVFRLFEKGSVDGLRIVAERIAHEAAVWFGLARARRRFIATTALPVLLPATLGDLYLRCLERCAFDPFDARLQRGSAGRELRILGARLRRRY